MRGLVSARLSLRRFEQHDGELVFELDNNPQVMKYINGGVPVSRETIAHEILPTFLRDDPVAGFRLVALRKTAVPLGWCCLRGAGQPEGQASLGYRFLPGAWGQGYAVEAASKMLDVAFSEALKCAVATTYEENLPSIRVLEKLGFSLKRQFRADLEQQETAIFDSTEAWPGWDLEFELTREAWQDRQKKGEES